MKSVIIRLAAGALALLPVTAAHAETTVIESGSGQRGLLVSYYGPVGQSFLATGSELASFGFQFVTFNAGSSNGPVTLTIREGEGLTGAIIATVSATIPLIEGRTPTWFDFDLSGTTLTVGQSYTALLSTASSRLGVIYGPDINIYTGQVLGTDAYADGSLISTRALDRVCTSNDVCDANFRVTMTGAVPEPAVWAMMVIGFGAVGGAMRQRRRIRISTAA